MKRLRVVLIILATAAGVKECAAQSKLELLFTNTVVTFTNQQGHIYNNADLVRANTKELVFKTNGDYGVVSFTNLSPETMKYVGISDVYVKRANDQEKQRAEAVAKERALLVREQQQLLNPTNLTEIMVLTLPGRPEFNGVYGNVYLCRVRLTNGAETAMYIARLPATIPAYFGAVQATEQTVSQLSNHVDYVSAEVEYQKQQLRRQQYEIDRANAVTPTYAAGDYWYVSSAANQRSGVNLAQVELDRAYDAVASTDNYVTNQMAALGDMRMRLDQLKGDPFAKSVLVLVSRYTQHGVKMAICAPDYLQAGGRATPPMR